MAANLNLAKAFVELSLKGGAAVVSGISGLKNRVTTILAPLANAFAPAQNAILGLVQAASPQAFNTFSGSMKILSSSIGQAFIPQIIQASKWIQDLARYIREMDPETKKNIASFVGWGVVVLGAVAGLTKLIGVLDVIATHPVAATFLAISAAILKVNGDMDKMIGKMNEAVSTMQRMKSGVFTESEYKRSAAGAIETDDSLSQEQKLAEAERVRAQLTKDVRAHSKEGMQNTTTDYGKGLLGQTNKMDEMQYAQQQKLKEAGMLDELISRLKQGKGGPSFTDQKDIDKGKGSGLAMAGPGMGGQGGGSISSLENAFSQTASAALAADEIQQQLLKQAMEGNQIAREAAVDIKRAADAQQRMQQP